MTTSRQLPPRRHADRRLVHRLGDELDPADPVAPPECDDLCAARPRLPEEVAAVLAQERPGVEGVGVEPQVADRRPLQDLQRLEGRQHLGLVGVGVAGSGREDLEGRMAGGDRAELVVGGVGAHALEEHADLNLPALEVGPQHRDLLVVAELARPEVLDLLADPELPRAGHAQVAHPLRFAAGSHEVALALVLEQVDRRRTPLAAGATPDGEHPRAQHAHTAAGQEGDGGVEDFAGEPAGGAVVRSHRPIVASRRSGEGPRQLRSVSSTTLIWTWSIMKSSTQPRNCRRFVSSSAGVSTARKRSSPSGSIGPAKSEVTSSRQVSSCAATISARVWPPSPPLVLADTTTSISCPTTCSWVESVASRSASTPTTPAPRPTAPRAIRPGDSFTDGRRAAAAGGSGRRWRPAPPGRGP